MAFVVRIKVRSDVMVGDMVVIRMGYGPSDLRRRKVTNAADRTFFSWRPYDTGFN